MQNHDVSVCPSLFDIFGENGLAMGTTFFSVMPLNGLCSDMCPSSERHHRIHNLLVHQLETDNPWSSIPTTSKAPGKRPRYVANPQLMVKEYARSAADKIIKAENVRPFPVLKKTIEYLLKRIMGQIYADSRAQWAVVYSFVMDRLRAIRQDMTVQDLSAEESMQLLEAIIPFYFEARQRCEDLICKSSEGNRFVFYDEKLHSNEMVECLAKWKVIVDDFGLGSEKIKTMYLLHHCDRVDILCQFLAWKENFANKNLAENLFTLLLAYRMNNFVAFFRLFNRFEVELRYALSPFARKIQRKALRIIAIAYNSVNVKLPEELIRNWLSFDKKEELFDLLADQFSNIDLSDSLFVKFSGTSLKTTPNKKS